MQMLTKDIHAHAILTEPESRLQRQSYHIQHVV